MRKILTIAWYDLVKTFRHPVALIFMLALPFALTLIMAAAFGGSHTGLEHIPVVVVNQDDGMLSASLVSLLRGEALSDLLDTTVLSDVEAARQRVEEDQAAAAVIIPVGFSAAVMRPVSEPLHLRVYANPSRPISAGVVRSIVSGFADSVNVGIVGGQVLFTTLDRAGALPSDPAAMSALGETWSKKVSLIVRQRLAPDRVRLLALDEKKETATFDPVAFIAPSMAIFTLLFTMTAAGRVFLDERRRWTLQRLFSTPTRPALVLVGKIVGIWWTGLAQLAILLSTSALFFGLSWGNPFVVALVCVAIVLAASGWGVIIAAYSRTPAQAQAIGTSISLVFGMTAGHFFPRENLPTWVRWASRISPNAWGLDAFQTLLEGGTLGALVPTLTALFVMAALLFAVATLGLRRQLEG